MEGKDRELTARQQAYFEHVRQAREQGLTLTAYCRKVGLNVRSLYGVRRDMVEKGIVPRTLAHRGFPRPLPATQSPRFAAFRRVPT